MMCPTCGIDAVDVDTGQCDYCPRHEQDLAAERAADVTTEGIQAATPDPTPAPKKTTKKAGVKP